LWLVDEPRPWAVGRRIEQHVGLTFGEHSHHSRERLFQFFLSFLLLLHFVLSSDANFPRGFFLVRSLLSASSSVLLCTSAITTSDESISLRGTTRRQSHRHVYHSRPSHPPFDCAIVRIDAVYPSWEGVGTRKLNSITRVETGWSEAGAPASSSKLARVKGVIHSRWSGLEYWGSSNGAPLD